MKGRGKRKRGNVVNGRRIRCDELMCISRFSGDMRVFSFAFFSVLLGFFSICEFFLFLFFALWVYSVFFF